MNLLPTIEKLAEDDYFKDKPFITWMGFSNIQAPAIPITPVRAKELINEKIISLSYEIITLQKSENNGKKPLLV